MLLYMQINMCVVILNQSDCDRQVHVNVFESQGGGGRFIAPQTAVVTYILNCLTELNVLLLYETVQGQIRLVK